MITYDLFEKHLIERHGASVHKKVKEAVVGIAGIGGLGSNIAMALARAGIGKLILVDFDQVELSNVNRQAYYLDHIGMDKVEAIKELISHVNPYITLETHKMSITRENGAQVFSEADVVIEAFDNPISKAALSEAILMESKIPLVAASGMAGALSSNTILTRKIRNGFYVCGDGVTDVANGACLMAPRVMVAAGHQANMALRLIIGEEDV